MSSASYLPPDIELVPKLVDESPNENSGSSISVLLQSAESPSSSSIKQCSRHPESELLPDLSSSFNVYGR